MGKKAAAKGKPQDETVPDSGAGTEGAALSGSFAADFPVLCEQEGLPPVEVHTLNSEEGSQASSRHAVLVEYDSGGDCPSLEAVHIRGWLLSVQVLSVLRPALASQQLRSLNLWNVGLCAETLSLVVQLAQQANLRQLALDGHTLSAEPLVELLTVKNSLEHLSLKCCGVDDHLLSTLRTPLSENRTLLTFDLSCNHIGDEGAWHLASALRLNRSLLSLVLTGNRIGDEGAARFAEVLARFPLNHEEVVQRRKLLSMQRRLEEGQSMLDVCTEGSPRRSPSAVSLDKSGKISKLDKSIKGKKGEPKREEKGRKEEKGKKGQEAGKKGRGKDSRAGARRGADQTLDSVKQEGVDPVCPLLDVLEEVEGRLCLPGNSALLHLGLAYNRVTEGGVQTLLQAAKMQHHFGPGLLRLTLHHNLVSMESVLVRELGELLQARDPLRPTDTTATAEDST